MSSFLAKEQARMQLPGFIVKAANLSKILVQPTWLCSYIREKLRILQDSGKRKGKNSPTWSLTILFKSLCQIKSLQLLVAML